MIKTRISQFSKLNESSLATNEISISNALSMIKNHPRKEEINRARTTGKDDKDKPYSIYQFGEMVDINYYDFIKNDVGAFTWSVNVGEIRRVKSKLSDENLTGFIYYDIDQTNLPLDELINRIKEEAYVVACWKSFGGKGAGFLVQVDGLTLDNYLSTWEHYKEAIEKNLSKENFNGKESIVVFDKATKDYTRLNAISYDPDIYINDSFYAISSIEPTVKKIVNKFSTIELSVSPMVNSNMLFVLDKIYNVKEYNDGTRLTYPFYVKFFSETNFMGIDVDQALTFLTNMSQIEGYNFLFSYRDYNTIQGYANHIYDTYQSQFGSMHLNCHNDIDGEITEINQSFSGTANAKKDYISYFLSINNIKTINKSNISFIAIKIKEKGIEKNILIDYVANYDEVIMNKINYIYDNPRYLFGITVKKNTNRVDFIVEKQYEGYNVHEKTKSTLEKSFLISEKEEEDLLIHFLDKCIRTGNSEDQAFEFFISNYEGKLEVSYITNFISFYYEDNEYRSGIDFSKKIKKVNTTIRESYALEDNQYLSDLKLDIKDNTIIWSDTNTGKTTYLCSIQDQKQIVLVPVIPLLKSIEFNHKCSVFYGERKNIKKDSSLIICTYSSFPKLYNFLITSQWDLKDYIINVDEWQHFIISSSTDYREEEMNFILNKLHLFKKRVMYTGTWIENKIPEFQNYNIVRVKKSRAKTYNDVVYNNKPLACEQLCDKNGLNLIYLQSKKIDKDLGTFKRYFMEQGWKEDEMLLLNNNFKDKPYFERLLKDEVIPDGIKLVFCTSLVAEGLNFNNKEVSTVHFCSKESPYVMEQVVNRFRKTVPKNIYLYKKYNDNVCASYFEGLNDYNENLIETTKEILKAINSTKNNSYLRSFSKKIHVIEKNNLYDVNYLTIAYDSYMRELRYANLNKEYMQNILKEYMWNYDGEIIVEDDISNDLKRKLKNLRNIEKNKVFDVKVNIKKEVFNSDLSVIKESIREENLSKMAVTSELPDFDYQLRKNYVYLAKYLERETVNNIMEVWQDENFSNIWYKKFTNQLKVQRQERDNFFDERVDYNTYMAKELKEKFLRWNKEDRKPAFLKQGLVKLVNDINDKYKNPRITTFEKAKEILEDFFVIRTVLDKNENIRYEISAINLLNEEKEHYFMFKSLINSALNGMIPNSFTKEAIHSYTEHFRAKLLGSGYLDSINGLSELDSFKMLNYYCNLSNKGRGVYEISNVAKWINEKEKVVS